MKTTCDSCEKPLNAKDARVRGSLVLCPTCDNWYADKKKAAADKQG